MYMAGKQTVKKLCPLQQVSPSLAYNHFESEYTLSGERCMSAKRRITVLPFLPPQILSDTLLRNRAGDYTNKLYTPDLSEQ
jgi:hypothetical protein